MKTIYVIEQILAALFITCYAYQLFYLAYMLVKKPARAPMASRKHRFGVVICARNEENVIGQLLSSVKAQDYPQELLEMFVVADNCTDATAAVARREPECWSAMIRSISARAMRWISFSSVCLQRVRSARASLCWMPIMCLRPIT